MSLVEIWPLTYLAILAITVIAYVYHGFLLMGHLEVRHRSLWMALGSPVPTKIFVFKFLGWIIRGGYKQTQDRELLALGRKTRYLLFACVIFVVIGQLGGRTLVKLTAG